jgi:HlyD family secretion protein
LNRMILIIGLVVAAALGGLGYYYWLGPGHAPKGAGDPPAHVVVAAPVKKTLRRVTIQPGQIEAFEISPLFAKLPGYVQKFYHDIGDHVEQDKPLADVGIPELQDEARQKESMLAYAKAGVQQALAGLRAAGKQVETAEAGLREARAGTIRAQGLYERWKSEHTRMLQLEASQNVDRRLVDESQNELSSAEAARGEAEAKVASAEAVLAERKVGVEKAQADLAVAQASVANADADVARMRSLLAYTQIRMPYTGVVIERNIDRGDFVQPASMATAKPLFVVAHSDVVRIFVDVPEMEAPKIDLGAKAFIHVQALPDQSIEGTVTRTSWALGRNRTLRTELDIPNPKRLLRPGMYATAEIVLEQRADVLALPLAAIVSPDKQPYCCCVEDGKIVRKLLTLGLRTPQEAEIVDGLKGNERVVQSQVAALQVGQPVEAGP